MINHKPKQLIGFKNFILVINQSNSIKENEFKVLTKYIMIIVVLVIHL